MNEANITKRVLIALSRTALVKLFRNNTAMGWGGKVIARQGNTITILNPHPINAGLIKGSSDLIGWTIVTVTPTMLGQSIAVFTAIEIKTPKTKPTPEQQNFINQVVKSGGIAGVATSEEEALALIKK